jgi:hypothetical protein
MIAPFGETPSGSFQVRYRSREVVAPCQPGQRSQQYRRGRIHAARDPGAKDAAKKAARLPLVEFDETGIDASLDGPLAQ